MWQEKGVTADATQADEKLQGRTQVISPFLIRDQGVPGVRHLWAWHIITVLTRIKIKIMDFLKKINITVVSMII